MKIGEIAERAGVTTSRIRFYERKGIIAAADRSENGYRDYPPQLIEVLQFIERAQDLGFSLKEIASIEIGSGAHIVSCDDALPMLVAKLESVTALIEEARARKAKIESLIAELQAGTKPVSADGERPGPSGFETA